jgi:excinuclease UvrABC ATPase subunit
MHMTIAELDAWGDAILPTIPKPAANHLRRIIRKTTAFRRVVCGHLSLDRKSSTLSGGELQRIRICSLLNANVAGVCYLLDEPSTGLHDADIESLTGLLKDLCQNGNTVVMVEHNPKMIRSCDWIVDIGPGSGANGGNLLFSDWTQNINDFNTSTALVLKDSIHFKCRNDQEARFKKWLAFDHLTANNLQDLSIRLPYGAFSAVCGVSGSGKTTFLRDVLNARIASNPQLFGFSSVVYLSQRSTAFPYTSTVATQLSSFGIIAKLFSKGLRIKPSCFLPNSSDGKCETCSGRRELLSDDGNIIGLCPECNGRGYAAEVLRATVSNVSFHELMETPLSEVGNKLCVSELSRLSTFCALLGIGHLTFSRRSNTLSQGELQRLHIANALSQNTGNGLFLLDEPSKGLHVSDAEKLVEAIRLLVNAGNTVVAVEHNLPVILGSDYIVELGGVGKDGGRLLFNDYAKNFSKADTPTSRLLSESVRPFWQRPSTIDGKSYIAFSTDGSVRSFPANSVHRLADSANEIKRLSLSTNADFLATAIPGNPLFSRANGIGEDEINISSPVVFSIDFAEASKFSYSLYGIFGLRDAVVTSVMSSHPDIAGLLQYVFNDESPTGKCSFCGGRGSAATIPESCFVDGSRLTKDCISFLKNSGSFQAVQTWFNHSKHFHLSDSLDKLDDSGKRILFYGLEGNKEHDFSKSGWSGLINFFLRNHSYYPNRAAENIYSKRTVSLCPICNGRRLDHRHSSLTIDGSLSYKAIMTSSFDRLLKRANEASSGWLKECRQILQLVCESGLGSWKSENRLCDLDASSAGMVRLVSIAIRGYVQSGIALFNVESLPSDRRKIATQLVERISRNNTVFIC